MSWKRYLFWFAHEHLNFRNSEINSLLGMFNLEMRFIETPCESKPYWIVEMLSDECVKLIASRSVSIKNCIELWSRECSPEKMHENLKLALDNKTNNWLSCDGCQQICPSYLIEVCSNKSLSFKIDVETFCKHFSLIEKIDKIEKFSFLPLEGPIKLKNPDITLNYIEFYGTNPNTVPNEPYEVFFGRWVGDGQRERIQKLSLKSRKFIGNTSMDAQLSLFMANQAQIQKDHIVIDPFVGSGSLLVAAAEFGAYVWGSDIDFMMLHARTRPSRVKQKVRGNDENIRANFRQYNFVSNYLDVVVSDFSLPLWREDLRFDSIITDPPYGLREPTEKIGIEREQYTLAKEHLQNHIPAKVEYGISQIFSDLLMFAAKHLKLYGRLVCWYPLVRSEYTEEKLPHHPCLELISNSEQPLSKHTSRRLLTYKKILEYNSSFRSTVEHIDSFRDKYMAVGGITRKEKSNKKL